MKIDAGQLRDQLSQLGGGAADAARGERTARDGCRVVAESAYEPIDRLLLKRLSITSSEQAAASAISFADAHELAQRTTQLMSSDPTNARIAHEGLLRRSLHNLLGH